MLTLDERKTVLVVSTVASFLTPFMASSVNIALPLIGREFSLDAISLSWVATSYILAAAMFLVPFGRLADIHGRKRIFIYGLTGYTIIAVLCGGASSGTMLIVFRMLHGISAAMIFGTGAAILTSAYPAAERGRVLGINVAAVYVGLAVGPFIGGVLTEYFGWRSVFVVNGILGFGIVLLVVWKMKSEWAEAKGEPFDLFGSILYGLSLPLLMYGFSKLPGIIGFSAVLLGVAGLIAFVMWEFRAAQPLLDMNLFRHNAVFTFSNLAALINYSATSAVTFLLSLYLQYIKELNPQTAGIVLIAQPVMMALFSPVAGKLSDRIEPRIVASSGMGFIIVGLILFAVMGSDAPLALIVLNLVFLGFGFALFSSPNTNAVMSSVEKRSYGIASATLGTMRLTGQMFSMGIVMLIFALTIGQVKITPEYYPGFLTSMRLSFSIFAALCVIGIFASLARGTIRSEGTSSR